MDIDKPVILLFTGHYLPGYKAGGILRTIVNTVDHLKDEFDFKIVTTDRDLGDSIPYNSIHLDKWNIVGNAQVYYLSAGSGIAKIRELIKTTKYDILHLNSFFDFLFTIRIILLNRLYCLPKKAIIVSPRGELYPSLLRFKYHKKKIFLVLVRFFNLYKDVKWHATDNQEAESFIQNLGINRKNISIARDLSKVYLEPCETEYVPDERVLKIIFLSRISKEKNLKYAIEILKKVTINVCFDIYGPIEEEALWNDCKKEIETAPPHIKINYCGAVKPDEVNDTMNPYDIFFLPTLGENYGHVIIDALRIGLPVLISDATPWRALAAKDLGWDINLNKPDDFISTIEKYSNIDLQQRKSTRIERKERFQKLFLEANTKKENYDLYYNLLQTDKP